MVRIAAIALIVSFAAPAQADDARRRQADALVTEGVELGRHGKFELAIERFREAERAFPRAIHACNIGLAYRLWKRYPQAYRYLRRCQSLATEKLPSWVRREEKGVLKRLRRGKYAPVAVHVAPAGAMLSLATLFGPDERLAAPVTLWLPHGSHELVATLAGHETLTHEVSVANSEPMRLDLTLARRTVLTAKPVVEKPATPPAEKPAPIEPAPVSPPPSDTPIAGWATLGSGVLAAGVGGLLHGLAVSRADRIRGMVAGTQADSELSSFDLEKGLALGMYGVGAVAIGIGSWLLAR